MMPGCKQQAMGNGNDAVSFHLLRGGFPPAAQWFPAIEPRALIIGCRVLGSGFRV